MASVSSLVDRVRMEIGDVGKSFVWKTTATGTNRYEMPYSPVHGETLAVFVDGVDVSDTVEVEEYSGVLTFDVPPPVDDVISVQGTHYRFFSETELTNIVDASARQHLFNRNDAFGRALTVENLPVVEEHPVSLLGAINALYTLATDASFDINIQTPDGVSIPRADRYRQLMDSIRARREQYDMLCQALNIGLTRIETFTFRRISRTTNKYVPVYMPQEVDDRTMPERIYLPIPTYGGTVLPSSSARFDLVFTQGDDFETVVDFPFTLADKSAKAQIRTTSGGVVQANIMCEVIQAAQGKLRLSLTKEQTRRLPYRATWDLQLSNINDASITKTYITGDVFVEREVTTDSPPPSSADWSPTGWENSHA